MSNIMKRLKQKSTWVGIVSIGVFVLTGQTVDAASIAILLNAVGLIAVDS